jgi:hypothetical protein
MDRLTHETPRQAQFRRDCEDNGLDIIKFVLTNGTETYAVKCGDGGSSGPSEQDVIDITKIKLFMANTDGVTILYVGAATR